MRSLIIKKRKMNETKNKIALEKNRIIIEGIYNQKKTLNEFNEDLFIIKEIIGHDQVFKANQLNEPKNPELTTLYEVCVDSTPKFYTDNPELAKLLHDRSYSELWGYVSRLSKRRNKTLIIRTIMGFVILIAILNII